MTEAIWRRTSSTLWRRTTTGVVLLPAGAEQPVQLGGSAALVWEVLDEPAGETDTTELLARACGEQPGSIAAEVSSVLRQLEALGAVEARDPAGC